MKGVLIVNVGSPKSPDVADVRPYLREFLMDPYVINKPFLLRWIIVNLFILPFRPKRSAEAYAKIYDKESGFPLVSLTEALVDKIRKTLNIPIATAMRYASPSIKDGIQALVDETNGQLSQLLLIPFYPQYALSSTKTCIEQTHRVIKDMKLSIDVDVFKPFYNRDDYTAVLTRSIQNRLTDGQFDHVLFSFHGLPESHLRQVDPTKITCLSKPSCCEFDSPAIKTCYRAQAYRSVQRVVDALKLPKSQYSVAFQSRLGREPWLQPFTDETVEYLAKKGVKQLAVVCPSFVTDCLETIEEIGDEAKEIFIEAGGEDLTLIPCLNDQEEWVDVVTDWCRQYMATKPIPQQLELV